MLERGYLFPLTECVLAVYLFIIDGRAGRSSQYWLDCSCLVTYSSYQRPIFARHIRFLVQASWSGEVNANKCADSSERNTQLTETEMSTFCCTSFCSSFGGLYCTIERTSHFLIPLRFLSILCLWLLETDVQIRFRSQIFRSENSILASATKKNTNFIDFILIWLWSLQFNWNIQRFT